MIGGIGFPELIVIFVFFVIFAPMIFILYIILKSDRLIRNDQEELSSEIKAIIQRMRQS